MEVTVGEGGVEVTVGEGGVEVTVGEAYGNLGSVLSSKGRTEEAEWAFRMALRYRVNMADVHYNIGVLLQGKEHFQEAIKSYELAIHYRPSLALAYLNLGQLLERLSRCEEAVLMYRRCSRLDGTGLKDPRAHEATRVSALLHLGRLYADQGRLTEAAQAYQEAVDKMPEYFPPQEGHVARMGPNRDSNLDRLVIRSLVCCESDTLYHLAPKGARSHNMGHGPPDPRCLRVI
uniref:Uncharacterized protein n=1 Tax=Timema monikensis TaxID=170555 RepID=A0A7R9DY04_9NEOP|nr:unnamed protein product [Timema monikensis]